VREAIDKTVAHTYKYADAPPRLVVRARPADPAARRFEAQVDTLASIGEVSLTASASVEVYVKSGRLGGVTLLLPADVNLLSLTGPSLRAHKAAAGPDGLQVEVAFTQDMEGDFRLELEYERLLVEGKPASATGSTSGESRVEVPTPRVSGAEVVQGRIAVEALSAVEVRPTPSGPLSVLDVAELPQQLVLRTTHPILAAYKYLQAEPEPRLTLALTRHRLADVQEASIDRADYRTLFTRDGLQVTTVEFTVRNRRKQFLKLSLPRGASLWSASVGGKPEKPAVSETKDGDEVLVKILNSGTAFPVRLVYSTPGPAFGRLGRARGALPMPDILVTRARWDVYVPSGMSYGPPSTNLDLVAEDEVVSREAMVQTLNRADGGKGTSLPVEGLEGSIPASGVHYAFEKLYANQSGQTAWFALAYATTAGAAAARVVAALGATLFWLGLGLYFRLDPRLPAVSQGASLGVAGGGLLVVVASVAINYLALWPAALVSLAMMAGMAGLYVRRVVELRTQPVREG
jgi:hypothetical protein